MGMSPFGGQGPPPQSPSWPDSAMGMDRPQSNTSRYNTYQPRFYFPHGMQDCRWAMHGKLWSLIHSPTHPLTNSLGHGRSVRDVLTDESVVLWVCTVSCLFYYLASYIPIQAKTLSTGPQISELCVLLLEVTLNQNLLYLCLPGASLGTP